MLSTSVWCSPLMESSTKLIVLHSHATLVRNYFSRRNNFGLYGSWLLSLSRSLFLSLSLSLSRSAMFDQINADVLFKRVNYLYPATFTCPVVFLYAVSTWMAVIWLIKCSLTSAKVNTWSHLHNYIWKRMRWSLLMEVRNRLIWCIKNFKT